MAIRLYDDAMVKKINSWLPKNDGRKIQVLKPDETKKLFTIEADEQNDKPLKLPLIALSRDTSIELKQPTMTPMSFDGLMLDSDTKRTLQLNGIPIYLTYQLDIYTRYFSEADEYVRNFVFNIINYPRISISIPYNNASVEHDSNIMLESQISDNSDIPERLIPGQFTRMSLRIYIDDAYLFSVPFMNNWSIEQTEDIDIE